MAALFTLLFLLRAVFIFIRVVERDDAGFIDVYDENMVISEKGAGAGHLSEGQKGTKKLLQQ